MTEDGAVISSSLIRGLIAAGEVERANECLGSPFQIRGIVAHGDKRGRTLGYPTANLVPDPSLIYPGHGVYACRAAVRARAASGAGGPPRPTSASARRS